MDEEGSRLGPSKHSGDGKLFYLGPTKCVGEDDVVRGTLNRPYEVIPQVDTGSQRV